MSKFKITIWSIVSFLLLLTLFERCATQGSPQGGPLDTIAPVLVFAEPEMYTVNFDRKKITFGFNEYVQVKNPGKELLISPPLKRIPKIWMKGKGFYFELDKDELLDSSTYIFNFGNSVVDYNQGNILPNFTYVFSTGLAIDSFGISGKILDALTLKPYKEPITVMLYESLNDSAPYIEQPRYIGRCLEDGSYKIEYVKAGTYRLIAIKDKNSNLKFDKRAEEIAFTDSLITFDPQYFIDMMQAEEKGKYSLPKDTVNIDSASIASDSTSTLAGDGALKDTLITEPYAVKIYGLWSNLFMFKEDTKDTLQKLIKKDLLDNRMIYFSFNQPVTDSFEYRLLYFPEKTDWCIEEYSDQRDSINLWITDTSMVHKDTLNLIVRFYRPDTLNIPYLSEDTMVFRFKPAVKEKRNLFGHQEKEKEKEVEYLTIKFNKSDKSQVELNDTFFLTTATPIKSLNENLVSLEKLVDTLWAEKDFTILKDSIKINSYHLNFELEEGSRYRFTFLDSCITDIYGLTNDTTVLGFTSKRVEQYGTLAVNFTGVEDHIIVLLIDNNEKTIKRTIINEDGRMLFKYIKPGTYRIKLVYDENGNGKWDTGNYLKKIQPERVKYFENTLNIRENWDHEEDFDLSEEQK